MKSLSPKAVRQAADSTATCSLLITLLVLLAIGIASYQTVRQLLVNDGWVAHTYQVIEALDAVQRDLENAETGQRGFLLTSDPQYLAPYDASRRFVQSDLDTVQALTQDDPLQQQKLLGLKTITAAKMTELSGTIALHRQGNPAAALAIVRSGLGKAQMDTARQTIDQMKSVEMHLLAERRQQSQAAGSAARAEISLGTLLAILLIAVSMLFVRRYLRQREQTEAENVRLLENARDAAVSQRNFVKDVLASVTEGRLALCDLAEELPVPQAERGGPIALTASSGLRELRQAAMAAARALDFDEARVQDLATSVSEAGMNAIAHGGGGVAQIRTDGDRLVQVWITDHGTGITLSALPQATLERGYSSAGTLGHGFWLMLKLCDRLFLLTGSEGTTVVMEQHRDSQEAPWIAVESEPFKRTFRTAVPAEGDPSTPKTTRSMLGRR